MKRDKNQNTQFLCRTWTYYIGYIILFLLPAFISRLLGYTLNQIQANREKAIQGMIGYLVLILLSAYMRCWQRENKSRRLQDLINGERIHLLERIYRVDFRKHGKMGKGQLIYRLSDELEEGFTDRWSFYELVAELTAVILSITINLLWMDWRFLPVFYGVIPICAYFSLKKADICLGTHEVRQTVGAQYRQILKEDIEGIYEISCMNQLSYFFRRFTKVVGLSKDAEKAHAKSVRTYQLFAKGFEFVCYFVTFTFTLWLISKNALGIGYLITVLGYAASFYLEFSQINYAKDLWLNVRAIEKDLSAIETLEPIVGGTVETPDFSEDIAVKFENVTFSYDIAVKQKQLGFHFEVKRGEKIAIVGPSGKGKSTLLRLLCRLMEPDSGNIYVCGHKIQDYSLKALRNIVAYMPQNTYLWEGSFKENILWGNSECEDAHELENMSEYLKIDSTLKNKLLLGGLNVSGGEAQKISFMRTLCRRGSILLLDEPTSNMDTKSTEAVYEMIQRLPRECTVIAVSHDRKISNYVDRVIEFDELQKDFNALHEEQ